MSDAQDPTDAQVSERLTADVISDEVSGEVVHPNTGETYSATFRDPTSEDMQELRELEEQAQEGEVEAGDELGTKIINEFLVDPDLDASKVGLAWQQAVTIGFMKAIGGDNAAMEDAQEFFAEQDLGNR